LVRDQGLAAALDWLCRRVKSSHGLDVRLSCDAAAEPADVATRLMLFKAARELLMNVAKHAGVTDVALVMERVAGPAVQITVTDQGSGFDAAALATDPRRRSGSGLWNIERRLGMIGGRIEIASKPGEGTEARLSAPLHAGSTQSLAIPRGAARQKRKAGR
jgi:signal transduction histidine kinase